MAGTLGLGAKPLPERMVVSVEPGLGRLPLMRLRTLALYVDGLIDVHPDAFRPLDTKAQRIGARQRRIEGQEDRLRSEEHTSELQSLMRSSYAVFCLKKK